MSALKERDSRKASKGARWHFGKGALAMLAVSSAVLGGASGAAFQAMVEKNKEERKVQAVAAMSTADEREKLRIQGEGRALELANKPLGSEKNLEVFARYICYKAVVNQGMCSTVPLKMMNIAGAAGTASMSLGKSVNRIESINVNRNVLTLTPKRAAFLLAHEWTHGDIALLTGGEKGYRDMARRAAFYFYRQDGKDMDTTLAMEAETDCLVYSRTWVRWVDGYPGYLAQVGAVETAPRHVDDATTTCTYWREILHGEPGMDYKALTPWIKE